MKYRESFFVQTVRLIRKNRKTYQRLMVSILLTFTFLFSVFFYIDSSSFNRNKETLSDPSYLVTVNIPDHINRSGTEFKTFFSQVQSTPDTRIAPVQRFALASYPPLHHVIHSVNYNYNIYPKSFGQLMIQNQPAALQDGSREFKTLDSVFVTSQAQSLLVQSGMIQNGRIQLYLPDRHGRWGFKDWTVQTTVDASELTLQVRNVGGHLTGNVEVFIPGEAVNREAFGEGLEEQFLIFTPYAIDILNLARRYEFDASASAQPQVHSRADMRQSIQLKWILGSLIFLVLAVNLQGSFANALKERRYEIGLRRALGAAPQDIVMQFFKESVLLILTGALLALFLVVDGFLLFRLFCYFTSAQIYTIVLTASSVLTMLTMTGSLLLLTGLSFSVSAMETNIVSALQGAGE